MVVILINMVFVCHSFSRVALNRIRRLFSHGLIELSCVCGFCFKFSPFDMRNYICNTMLAMFNFVFGITRIMNCVTFSPLGWGKCLLSQRKTHSLYETVFQWNSCCFRKCTHVKTYSDVKMIVQTIANLQNVSNWWSTPAHWQAWNEDV